MTQGRGGGKAYAPDLKSGGLKRLCGFDSHPRHHIEWFDWLNEEDYEGEYDDIYGDLYEAGYQGDALW